METPTGPPAPAWVHSPPGARAWAKPLPSPSQAAAGRSAPGCVCGRVCVGYAALCPWKPTGSNPRRRRALLALPEHRTGGAGAPGTWRGCWGFSLVLSAMWCIAKGVCARVPPNFAKAPSVCLQQRGRRRAGGHAWPPVPAPGTRAWGPRRCLGTRQPRGQAARIYSAGRMEPAVGRRCRQTAHQRAVGVCCAWLVVLVLGDGCSRGASLSETPTPQIFRMPKHWAPVS